MSPLDDDGFVRVPEHRVLLVQHHESEGPALIADALDRTGCSLELIRTDLGQTLPHGLAGYAGLVVMGGPMSAGSDDDFPTRLTEVALIRDALDRRLPMLGVCLGAQLLAVAGEAEIRRGPRAEIGWGTVHLEPAAQGDPLFGEMQGDLTVLHWHGETFDLPDGAVHLASSRLYASQAFRLGLSAWGLQFHVEVDPAAIARFVDAFGHEAPDGQSIVRDAPERLARSQSERHTLLERFAHTIDGGPLNPSLEMPRGVRETRGPGNEPWT